MLKRPHYIALSLVLFLVLMFLNLPGRTATQCKLALSGLFLPLFGLSGSVHALVEQLGRSLTPRHVILGELEQLRRENSHLRLRETQLTNVWIENERLRQALRLQQQLPWKVQYARVVLRDPANWWRTVQIDAGARQGVAVNMPVLTLDGQLVGKVQQVGASTARVALVGDPDCGVSAVVEEGTARDYGVVASSSGDILDASVVEMTYINRPTVSKPGQAVRTSGLGGVFPPGILVGHIIDTNSVGFGLYSEARVKLGANLDGLDDVWVILRLP
jgi:rod shape-determining protein MreC